MPNDGANYPAIEEPPDEQDRGAAGFFGTRRRGGWGGDLLGGADVVLREHFAEGADERVAHQREARDAESQDVVGVPRVRRGGAPSRCLDLA